MLLIYTSAKFLALPYVSEYHITKSKNCSHLWEIGKPKLKTLYSVDYFLPPLYNLPNPPPGHGAAVPSHGEAVTWGGGEASTMPKRNPCETFLTRWDLYKKHKHVEEGMLMTGEECIFSFNAHLSYNRMLRQLTKRPYRSRRNCTQLLQSSVLLCLVQGCA